MTDGSFRPAETDRHPNPVAEAIRWGIVEAQLLQAVGRGRGCNRKADNPIDILIMTNAPIPLPIQQMISDADLKPSIHDLQMAAGGIAFEKPSGAAAAYPQLWETLNAAEVAFRRAKQDQKESNPNNELIIRERLLLVATATYRKAGERFSPGTAYVDLNIVPDPKAWLTERIGTLAHFSMSVPQAPSEPVRQPSASAEPEPVAPPHAEPAPPQHRQRR
jgi:hypothetical protein